MVRFRVPQEDDDAPPPTPATHEEPVSESELSDATFSTDGPAAAARPAHRRRARRVPRKSTTYYLGYPAPRIIGKTKVIQKVFLPRLLLQLQKVAEDGRSYPVLEIFPATRIAGPVVAPRLARRFPGIFGVKRHLGYDDIVLVRRDDSDLSSDGTESEGEESLENRNLLAVYSPLKHSDEAEIVLDDGLVWVAKPLANGSYDFVHTDAEGNTTTARWARRHTPAVTPTSVSTDPSTPSTPPPPRYTFSIINPSTRRHPVMATLTPSSLAVQDTYTSVSASHSRHPPITRIGRSQSVTSSVPTTPSTTDDCESDSGIGISSDPDPSTERTVYVIDPPTKMLIAVTALWVALRAGWSQSYGPGSESASSSSSSSTPAAPTPTPSNASTFPLCASRTSRSRRNTWSRSSSTCDPVQQSQPSEFSSSASSPSPAPTAPVSRLGAFKRHSLPAQHPQKQQQHQPPSLCCSASVPGTPLAGSRTSTPVSVASAFAGGFINAGAASATGAEVRNGNANSTTNGTTYASDSEAAKAPPRRATSTGAAFMQRRLLVTSSSTASSAAAAAGAGVGVGNEADGVGEFPFPVQMQMQDAKRRVRQSLPPPPGLGLGVVQTQRQVSGRKRRGENSQVESEKGIFEDCGVTSVGAGKKGGVRARFSRWISKIGGGSSR